MFKRRIAFVLLLASAPVIAQSGPPTATPEARVALAKFAGCVVKNSPETAHSALTRDFRSTSYRSQLQALVRNNEHCFERGMMRAGGLPFAAAMAEHLLKADPAPLAGRLAAAANGKAAPEYGESDATAMCVVKSAPAEVAALIEAPVAGPAEAAAATALAAPLGRCVKGGDLDTNAYGLRSILATASYRLLAAQARIGSERG
jgi:hypothetical protein